MTAGRRRPTVAPPDTQTDGQTDGQVHRGQPQPTMGAHPHVHTRSPAMPAVRPGDLDKCQRQLRVRHGAVLLHGCKHRKTYNRGPRARRSIPSQSTARRLRWTAVAAAPMHCCTTIASRAQPSTCASFVAAVVVRKPTRGELCEIVSTELHLLALGVLESEVGHGCYWCEWRRCKVCARVCVCAIRRWRDGWMDARNEMKLQRRQHKETRR